MAIHRSLVIFAIVALMVPAISLTTDFVWAKDKQFFVGDTLVFTYNATFHNVYKVNGDDFQSCTVPSNNSLVFFTGNDTIKLATTGNEWYVCGVIGHCDLGMKLNITVVDGTGPAADPSAA
ncbi:hypothetical protein ES288_D11G268800v1 [Gossypium darwinii]|uniref:Phytocyanin domain-containing protein n=1 Tax=Gossypium darwinii TaxID=34276 RepID=A0A5D2APY1_GOSDA|nr:hypothetical protein ES288_D11G268800v1 [Gossypium darwinii]